VQIGTPLEILSEPANDYVASFTADVDRGRVLTAEAVMVPNEELTEADHAAFAQNALTVKPDATLQEIVPVVLEANAPVAVEAEHSSDHIGYIRLASLLQALTPQQSQVVPGSGEAQ